MGASRTLRNKVGSGTFTSGRKPGPIAQARQMWPVVRALRMRTPYKGVSLTPLMRVSKAIALAKLTAAQAAQ